MTIEIHTPELEALIRGHIASGAFKTVEDFLLDALKVTPPRHQSGAEPGISKPRKNLVDILNDPAFAGSNLDVARQRDYPRPLDL